MSLQADKMYARAFLLAVLTVTLVISCRMQPASLELLQDVACQAPCWLSIQMGASTIEQAQAALSKNQHVQVVAVIFGSSTQSGELRWRWKHGESLPVNRIPFVRGISQTVEQMSWALPGFAFGGLRSLYGDPDLVLAFTSDAPRQFGTPLTDEAIVRTVSLVYLSKGFMASGQFSGDSEAIIDSSFTITDLEMFRPNSMTALAQLGSDTTKFVKWTGNAAFSYYCKQVRDMTKC